ncbi:MAG: AraC family transcriptional regulator ligand-binding domain-containing protein [Bradymonadia bacterium]
MVRTIVAQIAWNTIRLAEAEGLDGQPYRVQLGLEGVEDPLHPVNLDVFYAVYGDIIRRLDDPGWPVRLASKLSPEDYSVVGFAVMTAPDGAEALRRGIRYQTLHCPSSHWTYSLADGQVHMEWHRTGPPALGYRAANEGVIAEWVQVLRALMGIVELSDVRFRHRAPPNIEAHTEFFGLQPRFSAESDGFSFSDTCMSQAPKMANPAMAAWFEAQLEARMPIVEHAIIGQVERLLLSRLPSGTPTLEEMARDMGVSPRTLRRRLQATNTRYSEVLDRVRQHEAQAQLKGGRATVAEVAWQLGYSDASAFTRAFRRWFGVAPGVFARTGEVAR